MEGRKRKGYDRMKKKSDLIEEKEEGVFG